MKPRRKREKKSHRFHSVPNNRRTKPIWKTSIARRDLAWKSKMISATNCQSNGQLMIQLCQIILQRRRLSLTSLLSKSLLKNHKTLILKRKGRRKILTRIKKKQKQSKNRFLKSFFNLIGAKKLIILTTWGSSKNSCMAFMPLE